MKVDEYLINDEKVDFLRKFLRKLENKGIYIVCEKIKETHFHYFLYDRFDSYVAILNKDKLKKLNIELKKI